MKNKIAQKNKSLTKYWNKIDEDFKKIEAHDINDFSRLDLENIKRLSKNIYLINRIHVREFNYV